MASSLFKRYPFDLPSEAFSFDRFKQAFAAVQASIVHLQVHETVAATGAKSIPFILVYSGFTPSQYFHFGQAIYCILLSPICPPYPACHLFIFDLQGVSVGKRFTLVPLGPPLLSYSSTSKAMLQYNSGTKSVQLVADRDYAPGELLTAW